MLLVTLALAAEPPPAVEPVAVEPVAVEPVLVVPAPAFGAGVGVAPEALADQALLDALLELHGEARIAGVAALVATQDPRAVGVLADLVNVLRSGPVVDAATLGLARFPEGPGILAKWVLEKRLPTETRIGAARALGAAHSTAAADALVATTGNRGVAGPLRAAVMETITLEYPERLPNAKRVSDAGSVAWTTLGFGTGLGYSVATLGHFGRTQLEVLGAAAGGVGGATGGWFYARRRPTSVGDAAYVTLSEWTGTAGGLLLASGTGPRNGDQSDRVWIGGLIGLGAGTGIGLATAGLQQGSGVDAWETGILTGAGIATTGGGFAFVSQGRSDSGTTVLGAATLGSFAAASLVSPHIALHDNDIGFVGMGTAWGAVVGGFVPLPNGTHRSALPVATGGVAGITAWSLAPQYQRPGDELLGGWLGLGLGTTLGGGLSLLEDPLQPSGWGPVAGATVGTLAGMGLANVDPARVDGSDIVWGGLGTGWVAWQTLGWLSVGDNYNDRTAGIALTAIGTAGSASALASRFKRIPYAASLTMGSTALWGTYIGATTAQITGGDPLQAALIGGDIGLAVGSVGLIPRLQVAPAVVGVPARLSGAAGRRCPAIRTSGGRPAGRSPARRRTRRSRARPARRGRVRTSGTRRCRRSPRRAGGGSRARWSCTRSAGS